MRKICAVSKSIWDRGAAPEVNSHLLYYFMLALWVCQPLLDILSYWLLRLSLPIQVATALRAGVLVAVTGYAFWLVPRMRKWLLLLVIVLVGFWILHYAFAYGAGVKVIGADLNQYIKTIQLPLFIVAFYSLFTLHYAKLWSAFLRGTTCAFWIVLAAGMLAWLTATGRPTYIDLQKGFLGWYYVANAQSILLAILFPLALFATWQWGREKELQALQVAAQEERAGLKLGGSRCVGAFFPSLIFALTALAGGVRLFYFATRVTYASLFTTAIALFSIILVASWRRSLPYLLTLLILGGGAYLFLPQSPMYQLRANDQVVSHQEQETLEKSLHLQRKLDVVEHDFTVLAPIYEHYLPDLVAEFGLPAVAEEYAYSTYFIELRNVRAKKIHFAALRLRQMPARVRWTGLNFASMQVSGVEGSYDLETDPPAVFYYTGYVGVAFTLGWALLLLLSLGRQLWQRGVLSCLRDIQLLFQGYLLLLLTVAAATGGSVLRRPSVSIYFSLVIATLLLQERWRH